MGIVLSCCNSETYHNIPINDMSSQNVMAKTTWFTFICLSTLLWIDVKAAWLPNRHQSKLSPSHAAPGRCSSSAYASQWRLPKLQNGFVLYSDTDEQATPGPRAEKRNPDGDMYKSNKNDNVAKTTRIKKKNRKKNDKKQTPTNSSRQPTIQSMLGDMQRRISKDETLSKEYLDKLLSLCVVNEEKMATSQVLDLMESFGYKRDESSYRACLQTCYDYRNGSAGQEVIADMKEAMIPVEPYDIGLVVGAMCRSRNPDWHEPGLWEEPIKYLNSMAATFTVTDSNTIPIQAYNMILECMAEQNAWWESLQFLKMMENQAGETVHPVPQITTYRIAAMCCLQAGQAKEAISVLKSMKENGVKVSGPFDFTKLVLDALCDLGERDPIMELWNLMDEVEAPKPYNKYHAMISACCTFGDVDMSMDLISQLYKKGLRPNAKTYNLVILGCSRDGNWKKALSVLDQCESYGIEPNFVSYTATMRVCLAGGAPEEALKLYDAVRQNGSGHDLFCARTAIDACFRMGNVGEAFKIYQELRDSQVVFTADEYTAYIYAFAGARLWRPPLELFEEMRARNFPQNQNIFSTALWACGEGGKGNKALELFKLMREKEMTESMTLAAYNKVLKALSKECRINSKSSRFQQSIHAKNSDDSVSPSKTKSFSSETFQLLEDMKKDGLVPDSRSYVSTIMCFAWDHRWEEPMEIFKQLDAGGPDVPPVDSDIYNAVIFACGQGGQTKLAMELYQNSTERDIQITPLTHASLFTACRVAGDVEMARELWKEKCLTREPHTPKNASERRGTKIHDLRIVWEYYRTMATAGFLEEADEAFQDAIDRNFVDLPGYREDEFPILIDIRFMNHDLARATVRYVMKQCSAIPSNEVGSVVFVTGYRTHKNSTAGTPTQDVTDGNIPAEQQLIDTTLSNDDDDDDSDDDDDDAQDRVTLRDFVQSVLETNFDPPIQSEAPAGKNTVEVDLSALERWEVLFS